MMNKLFTSALLLIIALAMASCANSYTVQGSSNISNLDGRMLYLKVLKDGEFKNIDSCDVVHGKFQFRGTLDTVRMVNLFMEDEQVLPLVLEEGDINIKMDNTQMEVSGSPLNDKLFAFMKQYNQITGARADLVHRHDQAIMDGSDMNTVIPKLQMEEVRLTIQEDSLVTGFITDNFDNVLGPGVFFLTTISYDYPLLTPWVEAIMSKATEKFKADAYVSDYYKKAQENQQIMNGLREAPQAPVVAPQQGELGLGSAPTPNELAAPVK